MQYEDSNPDKLLKDKKAGIVGSLSKKAFESVMHMKYLNSVIDPGDAVGIVAGQSIGSQTTQMTLNTYVYIRVFVFTYTKSMLGSIWQATAPKTSRLVCLDFEKLL